MCEAGIKSHSLPQIIICENGEDCGTEETQPSTITEDREDSTMEQMNNQSPKKIESTEDPTTPTTISPSHSYNPNPTLAENLAELNFGDSHNIVATTMSIGPKTMTAPRSSPEKKKAATIEEKGELPALHVGRIIGKGGEMIRDLQARSGCHIDVDQNVEPGAPKIVTYRGRRREDIELAKRLVDMLCMEGGAPGGRADLPLGRATTKRIQVPESAVGRIIGRGGEMIHELQRTSEARIQVDHNVDANAGVDAKHGRKITITGTKDSVASAEEMIRSLSLRDPSLDERTSSESSHRQEQWMSPPCDVPATRGPGPYWPTGGQATYDEYGNYYGSWNMNSYTVPPPAFTETEVLPCDKKDIGRIIGRKGATIHDLQWRSNCIIHIDQQSCQISVTGPRQGIGVARQMMQSIINHKSSHPNDGGRRLEHQEPSQQRHGYQPQQGYPDPWYGMIPQQLQYYGYGEQPPVSTYQQQQQSYYAIQQVQQENTSHTSSPWRAAATMDGQIYYYNQNTLETRWDKPAEM